MSSVSQFLAGHQAAGLQPRWAYAGTAGTGNDKYVLDVPAHLPAGIAHADLTVVIAPRGHGSLIRAEAQVIWYPTRSAAEYVHPGRYQSVTVTVPVASQHGTVSRVFTSRTVITEPATLLNRLPGMLPTAFSCPDMAGRTRFPPTDQLVFTPRSRRWPVITAAPVGCFGGGVQAGPHQQPALDFSRDGIIPVMTALTR